MNLHELVSGVMDWINLAQNTEIWRGVVNAGINIPVP